MPDEVLSLSTGGISEDLDIIWLEIVVPLKALFVAVCGAPLEKKLIKRFLFTKMLNE